MPYEDHSLWTAAERPSYPPLTSQTRVDVAIVGAGIVGLTAALRLQEAGRSVAVIEALRVGRQVTGRSSAKVTSQHGLIYARLVKSFGRRTALAYAEANEAGLDRIATTVSALGIDCSFERRAAYTYTTREEGLAEIRAEVEVAQSLGLPARFVDASPLPLPIDGAVVFDGQAQFDPYAYASGVAVHIATKGLVVEETRVLDLEDGDDSCRIDTDRGTLFADDVIVATNIPILDRGLYFARAFPIGHAVIAARIEGEPPDGMFISTDQPSRSVRGFKDARGSWVVVVGPRYRPGTVDTEAEFSAIEAFAREHFAVVDVPYRWTNEDYASSDGLPYIGKLLPNSAHLYVATGFGGWGITNGTVAGEILADAIVGRENPWAEVYDANRVTPIASARRFVVENLRAASEFIGGRLGETDDVQPADLAPGDGAIVEIDGERVAVSRDFEGRLCAVSAICTHIGCVVAWNRGGQSWDCPCHGSTFAADGSVIHGPATENLPRVELPNVEVT